MLILSQNSSIFSPSELATLQSNLSLMRSDIRAAYLEALEVSHHGYPSVTSTARSGNRGRPQIIFDPGFLAWAYNRRSISALARFLGVGRTTLRNALIQHGIMETPGNSLAGRGTAAPLTAPDRAEGPSKREPWGAQSLLLKNLSLQPLPLSMRYWSQIYPSLGAFRRMYKKLQQN